MSNEFKVGITVLVALVTLFFGLSWLQDWSLSKNQLAIVAEFEDTGGLLVGDPVYYRGMKVGQVALIEHQSDFISVKISVNETITLFTDSKARIGMFELLAGKKIDILPGISGVPIVEGGVIQGILGADIPRMLGQVDAVGDDLKQLIRNLNITLENLNSVVGDPSAKQNTLLMLQELAKTSKNLSELTQNINNNSGRVSKMVDGATELVQNLNALIIDMKPGTNQLLTETSATMVQVRKTVEDLQTMINDIKTSQSLASKLLYDEKFAGKFTSTIDTINLMMNHIRQKPIKLDIDIW